MKKRIFCIVLMLLLVCAAAYAAPARLGDNANLLTQSQREEIKARCDALSAQYNLDVVIATTNDSRGMQLGMYAADLVDYNNFSTDNIILVVAMDQRKYVCVTTGAGIMAFSDQELNWIYDVMESDMRAGDYAGAFHAFLDCCEQVLSYAGDMYIDDGPVYDGNYAYVNVKWEKPFTQRIGEAAAYTVLPAFLIAWLVAYLMKSAMRTSRPQESAHSYLKDMNLTRSRDVYLYTTTARHKIERNNNSGGHGGGSHSTFSGSSGRSHGGGGGGRGF